MSSPNTTAQEPAPQDSFGSKAKQNFLQMSMSQRIGLAVVSLLIFGGLIWIVLSAGASSYRPLFTGISEAQSAQIIEALDQQGIPYKIGSGSTISVPEEHLYQARIKLAGQGMPEFDGVGFELFDKNEFGMTAFTQKVNYQRAMENELARTIKHIKSIKKVRVHLVLPDKTLFKEDQRPPSASVIIGLQSGGTLPPEHVRSIRHLVASAVEGLDARDIALIDSQGKMLAKPRGAGSAGTAGSDPGDEVRTANAMESELEARVTELLAPVVGASNVRTKVSIELDTRQIVETAESYDPDKTAVRREQRSEEESQKPETSVGGVAGASAQLRGSGSETKDSNGAQRSKLNEIIDYEVNKNVRQTTSTGVRIKRLSVAVLLDDSKLGEAPAAKKEGETEGKDAAAAAALAATKKLELGQINDLVKSAVGFDQARGDQVQVMRQTFQKNPAQLAEPMPFWQEPMFLSQAVRWGAVTLIALLLLIFVVKPLVSSISRPGEVSEVKDEETQLNQAVGRTVAELEAELESQPSSVNALIESEDGALAALSVEGDPVKERQGELRAEIIELAHEDMDRASEVVSQWIRVS